VTVPEVTVLTDHVADNPEAPDFPPRWSRARYNILPSLLLRLLALEAAIDCLMRFLQRNCFPDALTCPPRV
jgi:hypothetical protein